MNTPVVVITGAAKRIGAACAKHFHQHGYRVIISYRHSHQAAVELIAQLNQERSDSAACLPADLSDIDTLNNFAKKALDCFGRVDVLINNASVFEPNTFAEFNESLWQNTINTNTKAALILSQRFAATLKQHKGCIINLVDIYAEKPLKNHAFYNISKAGTAMLTKSLAIDLAPDIRTNGISPGAILWPEKSDEQWQQSLLEKIPLQRLGQVEDIAKTALFLAQSAYINGQIIAVDGGRSLYM